MLFDALRVSRSNIAHIDLSSNRDVDDEIMKGVGEYIKENKHIKELYLLALQISDTGIAILTPYLDGNSTLTLLDFEENHGITDKSIPSLILMVESSRIENLCVVETSIENTDVLIVPLSCNIIKNGSQILDLSQT